MIEFDMMSGLTKTLAKPPATGPAEIHPGSPQIKVRFDCSTDEVVTPFIT